MGVPMRERYARLVALGDKGSRELGFADVGAFWRSNYDMPPDAFAAEVDRLWEQLRRCIYRCTPTCAGQLVQPEIRKRRGACRMGRSRRTCWEIFGRRSGTTSIR